MHLIDLSISHILPALYFLRALLTLPNSYRSEGGFRGGGGGGGGGGRGKPPGIRLVVTGVSRDTSWQVCSSIPFDPWRPWVSVIASPLPVTLVEPCGH